MKFYLNDFYILISWLNAFKKKTQTKTKTLFKYFLYFNNLSEFMVKYNKNNEYKHKLLSNLILMRKLWKIWNELILQQKHKMFYTKIT